MSLSALFFAPGTRTSPTRRPPPDTQKTSTSGTLAVGAPRRPRLA